MAKPLDCVVMNQATYEAQAARRAVEGIEACRSQPDVEHLVKWIDTQGRGPRAARPGPGGLVRLETSDTAARRPASDELKIEDARRRYLRLFKSLSCAGDLHRLAVDENGERLKGWFLTMTYKASVDWEPGQITGLIKCIRSWADRRGAKVRFVWVAEQHKSGRVHYHAIVFLPARRRLRLPFPDRMGWWPHGMTQREELRKHSVGYLIKYATKCKDPARPWPKGCRLHGNGGLDRCERIRRAWWVLPKYIRTQCEDWMRVRRCDGGGWISPETGQTWVAFGKDFVGRPNDREAKEASILPLCWWVNRKKSLSGQELK